MRRAVLLALASACVAHAAWPALPPLDGELAGKLTSTLVPGAPELGWKLRLQPATGGRRHAELAVDAEGTRVRAHAVVDPATGDGEWGIDSAEIDAAVWWRVVAAKLGGDFAAAIVSGKISVTGGGTLRGGQPAGAAVLAFDGGRVTLTKPALEITGISARIEVPVLPSLDAHGTLLLPEVRVAGLALRAGKVVFAFHAPGTLNITEAGVAAFDGVLQASPFRMVLAEPAVALTVKFDRLRLDELALCVPQALAEAHGRAEGQIALGWTPAGGLSFGDGWLRLAEGTPASVRLTPVPGLITGQLPPGNPARAALSRVELGHTPISLRLLHAEFHPAGDEAGRTATLKLEGEPVDPQLIAPLRIDVNVAGPLDQLVRLGFDDRMKARSAP